MILKYDVSATEKLLKLCRKIEINLANSMKNRLQNVNDLLGPIEDELHTGFLERIDQIPHARSSLLIKTTPNQLLTMVDLKSLRGT